MFALFSRFFTFALLNLFGIALAAPLSSVLAPSQNQAIQTAEQQESHVWNLQNADIMSVIAEVSRQTGKNFVVSPQVTGRVTIISAEPISAQELYPVFLSALQSLGYSAVPAGQIIKIAPIHDATQLSRAINQSQSSDAPEVYVLNLNYVSAMQLVPVLTPLIPAWANLAASPSSNSLIISGTADVVQRALEIVKRIDTPAANDIDVVFLKNANADDVVKEVEKIAQASRFTSGDLGSAVAADDRSNSVLISGNAGTRLRIKVLLTQLDVNHSNNESDTQVIRLHYKPVASILPVLRGIAHESIGNTPTTTSTSSSMGASSNSGSSTSNLGSTTPTTSGSGNDTSDSVSINKQITNSDLNAGASSDKDTVAIVGDVATNAIVITAPANLMRQLKSVIAQLDMEPKQILVQGIIAEVDANKMDQFGVQWGTSNTLNTQNSSLIGSSSPFSLAGGGLGVGIIQGGSISAVVAALQSDTTNNILSTPSVIVMDNESADIEVGKTIPETSGQYQPGNSSNTNPYTTYDFKNVGLVLNVIPQITDDNAVRLQITQTNSTILPNANGESSQNVNPTTSNEKIETTAIVKDAQILVLGGLTESNEEENVSKIPVLGQIPLIGTLFSNKTKTITKRNLLIFLRPVILNIDQASSVSTEKYNWIRLNAKVSANNRGRIQANDLPAIASPNEPLPTPFSGSPS